MIFYDDQFPNYKLQFQTAVPKLKFQPQFQTKFQLQFQTEVPDRSSRPQFWTEVPILIELEVLLRTEPDY